MVLKSISYNLVRMALFTIFAAYILLGVVSCDSKSGKSTQSQLENTLEVINIGRLICGGHLSLAIVEKKYQDQLKTFKLNTIQNHDWNDVVADMKSGKLAGTFILSPLAMNLIREGFPGRIVYMADRNGNGFVLSDKIKSIEELKNRKSIIAVPHAFSQHHVLLHTILKQYEIPKKNITVLAMPPRDMINALRNEQIEGFVVGEPEANKSISSGVGWMAEISPQIWKDHMDHVFIASDEFIKNKPEQLQALINQLVRAAEFIENHPHEAAILGEDYTGSQAKIFEEVLTTPPDWITYANTVAGDADMVAMAEKLVDMKLWPEVPEDITSGYLDMRFVKEAEQAMR